MPDRTKATPRSCARRSTSFLRGRWRRGRRPTGCTSPAPRRRRRRRIAGLRERRRVAGLPWTRWMRSGTKLSTIARRKRPRKPPKRTKAAFGPVDDVEQLDLELHRVLAALDGERGVRRQQHAPRAADGHPGDRLAEDRLLAVAQRQSERILARAALEDVVGVHHLRRICDGDDLLATLGHLRAAPFEVLELIPLAVPQDDARLLLLADFALRRAWSGVRRGAERRRQVERERGGREQSAISDGSRTAADGRFGLALPLLGFTRNRVVKS